MRNYCELLSHWAKKQPDKICLTEDSIHYTYNDLENLCDALCQKLPADCSGSFLVLADTAVLQLTAFLSLQKAGLIPILLHHGLTDEETASIIKENQLQGLFRFSADSVLYEPSDELTVPHNEPDILGVLSSGSTGTPKVMYRTYESWAGYFPKQNPIFGVNHNTRMFLHGSLSFTGNMNSLLSVLFAGGTVITCRPLRCRLWAKLIQQENADTIYLVPSKLTLLTGAVRGFIPEVRHIFTGSQLLSAQNIKDLKRLFPKAELILYYGASELNYITYAVCDDPDRDPRNLGKPFPDIGLTVKDGLIYVDTKYHISGAEIPFTVKDTGHLNENGELIFEGRRDAWINKGGVKISTQRIENLLLTIQGVSACAVLPYEDKIRGTDAAAFIVLEKNISEADIRSKIKRILKPVEVPGKVRFVAEIPLNDRGKVDKKSLLCAKTP
ncbi:AMP-binding protein [Schwartzia sp. (in: firmicutes)]